MAKAEVFLRSTRARLKDDASLESLLDGVLDRCRTAWPQLHVPDETFLEHLARHAEPRGAWAETLEALLVEDLYLACACGLQQPAALRAWETLHAPRTKAAIQRVESSVAFVEEVQQLLREKLFVAREGRPAKIREYAGRAPLSAWLCAAAARTALNHLQIRPLERGVQTGELEALPAAAESPELDILRTRFRAEFTEAFQAALDSLDAKQRNLLRLHLLDGLSIDKLGVMFATHRSTVARWIAKSRETLMERTKEGLVARLRVDREELDALLGLVRSRLDVSIGRFLRG